MKNVPVTQATFSSQTTLVTESLSTASGTSSTTSVISEPFLHPDHIPNVAGKYRHVMDNGVNKTCMAACRDQTFSVSVSNNKYPGEESYNHRPAFCVVVRYSLHLFLDNFIVSLSLENSLQLHVLTNT